MKKFKITMILLGLVMLLNGCSGLKAETTVNGNQQEVKVSQETLAGSQKEGTPQQSSNTNASGQKRKAADLVGEIGQIVGNEITLKLVNMPKMSEGSGQGQTQTDSTKDQKKNQPKAITGSTDGGFPGGGFQGGPPREAGSNSTTQKSDKVLNLDYTGEEKTITIPVGMTITSGRSQTGVTFETLQEGNVLSIWLDDKGAVEQARLISGGKQ